MTLFTVSARGFWDRHTHVLSTSIASSRPPLPRLDNPTGQVDLLGDESRARPDETAAAWVQAQGNEPAGDAYTTCAANTAIAPPDRACAFIAVPPRSQSEEYTPLFARCYSPALSREAHRVVDGTLSATVHPPTHRSEPAPPPSQRVPGREQATTRASPLGSRGSAYPAPSQGRTPRPSHIQRSPQPQRPTGRDILLHEQSLRLLSRPRVANAGAHLLTLFADERHSSRRRGRSTRCSPESESAG